MYKTSNYRTALPAWKEALRISQGPHHELLVDFLELNEAEKT